MGLGVRQLAWWIVIVGIAACAKTEVSHRNQTLAIDKLARPGKILVYDFVATPEDVPSESALRDHPSAKSEPPSAEQLRLGREVGAEVAEHLVEEINALGLLAVRGSSDPTTDVGDLVLRGTLLTVEAGSAVERVAIGMGAGNAELKTAVEGFLVTEHGLQKLGGGTVDSGGGKTPGAALPLGVAVATHNPIGLVVSTGVKLHGEESGSSTIHGKAKQTAGKIAEELKPRFQEQGWIP